MKQRLDFHMNFVNGREIVLWGTGVMGNQVAKTLEEKKIDFAFSVSNDVIQKSSFWNRPVKPKNVLNPEHHYVIISTIYHDEVIEELKDFGYIEKLDFYAWSKELLFYDIEYDGIFIGRNTFGYHAFSNCLGLSSPHNVIDSIGRFTSINHTVQIHGDHVLAALSTGYLNFINEEEKYNMVPKHHKLTIGNDVWIGANTFINFSKVRTIGNGAVIGAGAVVINDVPPYAVVAGVPAKIKKYRFTEEQIKVLERVKWWEWDDEKLKAHSECFLNPELFFAKYG